MGLLDALKSYVADSAGGSLNPEIGNTLSGLLNYGKDRAKYIGGLLDDSAPINQDLQNWHRKTQLGLADLIAGKEGPQADYGYSQMMNMAGVAPLGMFIGKGAKTWDAVSMGKAQQMAKEGADPRAIWKETGTWQGPDGHWRQEIPDNAADFKKSFPSALDIAIDPSKLSKTGKSWMDIFKHDDLSKAKYPAPGMTTTHNINGTIGASFDPTATAHSKSGHILVNQIQQPQGKSSALHELQHSIQEREGWAKGGNANEFLREKFSIKQDIDDQISAINEQMQRSQGTPRYSELMDLRSELIGELDKHGLRDSVGMRDAAHKQYERLAGEAEARATQARMNMDAAQRRNVFPEDSYDVPLSSLIIRR